MGDMIDARSVAEYQIPFSAKGKRRKKRGKGLKRCRINWKNPLFFQPMIDDTPSYQAQLHGSQEGEKKKTEKRKKEEEGSNGKEKMQCHTH